MLLSQLFMKLLTMSALVLCARCESLFLGLNAILAGPDAVIEVASFIGCLLAYVEISRSDLLPVNDTLELIMIDNGGLGTQALLAAVCLSGVVDNCLELFSLKNYSAMVSGINISTNFSFDRVEIIVGPEWSGLTEEAQSSQIPLALPSISYSATSFDLTNPEFSMFTRVCPHDGYQSKTLLQLCRSFGWDQIAIVHASDGYSAALSAQVLLSAPSYGVTVSYFASIQHRSIAGQIQDELSGLKNSRLSIIFLLMDSIDVGTVVSELRRMDMMRWPYTYIGPDAYSTTPVASQIDGFIGTCLFANYSSPKVEAIQSSYSLLRPGLEELLLDSALTLSDDMSPFGLYAYDATMIAAIAIARKRQWNLYCEHGVGNSSVFATFFPFVPAGQNYCSYWAQSVNERRSSGLLTQDILRSVVFEGASGTVQLDADGERIGASYGIYNSVNGIVSLKGYGNSASIHLGNEQIVFAGGSLEVPPCVIPVNSEWRAVLVGFGALNLIMLFGFGAFMIKHRSHRAFVGSGIKLLETYLVGALLAVVTVFSNISASDFRGALIGASVSQGLLFGSLIAKLYRVDKLFNNSRLALSLLTDLFLLKYVVSYTSAVTAVLALWVSIDQSEKAIFAVVVLFVLMISEICYGLVLVHKCHRVPPEYSDAASIGHAFQSVLLLLLIWIWFWGAFETRKSKYGNSDVDVAGVTGFISLLVVSISCLWLFCPKVVFIFPTLIRDPQGALRILDSHRKIAPTSPKTAPTPSKSGSTRKNIKLEISARSELEEYQRDLRRCLAEGLSTLRSRKELNVELNQAVWGVELELMRMEEFKLDTTDFFETHKKHHLVERGEMLKNIKQSLPVSPSQYKSETRNSKPVSPAVSRAQLLALPPIDSNREPFASPALALELPSGGTPVPPGSPATPIPTQKDVELPGSAHLDRCA